MYVCGVPVCFSVAFKHQDQKKAQYQDLDLMNWELKLRTEADDNHEKAGKEFRSENQQQIKIRAQKMDYMLYQLKYVVNDYGFQLQYDFAVYFLFFFFSCTIHWVLKNL